MHLREAESDLIDFAFTKDRVERCDTTVANRRKTLRLFLILLLMCQRASLFFMCQLLQLELHHISAIRLSACCMGILNDVAAVGENEFFVTK